VLEWCDAVFEFAAKPSRFRFNAVDLGLAISEAPFNAAEATTHFGAERISFNLQQDDICSNSHDFAVECASWRFAATSTEMTSAAFRRW